jgi:hypothetical protein
LDLAIESCTRSSDRAPLPPSPWWTLEWEAFLDRYDGKAVTERPRYFENVYKMTLHPHARLLPNDVYPLFSLPHGQNEPNALEWHFDEPHGPSYNDCGTLEIRHLSQRDAGWEDTLEGCVWLVRFDAFCLPGAEVQCRAEMVLPLMKTVSFESRICLSSTNDIS